MTELGHYKKLSLHSLWKHEAANFTPWLSENLDTLSEAVGFSIIKPTTELATKNFFVDIVGVTGEKEDKIVVIENQYGNSNHDHLGKLITYAAAKGARFAIWIAESARSEHIQAINMLNKSENGCNFFLIEATVFQIDNSNPVIRFNKVAGPDSIDDLSPSVPSISIMYQWWEMFTKIAKDRNIALFSHLKPQKQHWLTTGAGRHGVFYELAVTKTTATIKVGLSKWKDREWGNKCFDILYPHRIEIEECFGASLEWEKMPQHNLSKISKTYEGGYDSGDWQALMNNLLTELVKLEQAFRPYLPEL